MAQVFCVAGVVLAVAWLFALPWVTKLLNRFRAMVTRSGPLEKNDKMS